MKRLSVLICSVSFFFCVLSSILNAQQTLGGIPPTFVDTLLCGSPPVLLIPVPDTLALMVEDSAEYAAGAGRFGVPFFADTSITDCGRWDTGVYNGDSVKICRLQISGPGAKNLSLVFDGFYIPPGGLMYIYAADKSEVLGAFSNHNNKPSGKFATVPISSNAIVVEYIEPLDAVSSGDLHIQSIVYGYRIFFSDFDSEASATCHIDIGCTEGSDWCREKQSVCMMLHQGRIFCTGVLVNNGRNDLTPYLLTAFHCVLSRDSDPFICGDPSPGPCTTDVSEDKGGCEARMNRELLDIEKDDVENYLFVFHGYANSCNSSSGPSVSELPSFHGAEYVSGYWGSDFALLRLLEQPGSEHGLFYSGWTNEEIETATELASIHHPLANYMKISRTVSYMSMITDDFDDEICFAGDANAHWRHEWSATEGTVQSGSSGAPLYNQDHYIIGLLTGNDEARPANEAERSDRDFYCDHRQSKWGKIGVSWNRETGATSDNTLKPWLDPDNNSLVAMKGLYVPLYLYNKLIEYNQSYSAYNSLEIGGDRDPYLPYYDTKQYFLVEGENVRCTLKAENRIVVTHGVHIKRGTKFRAFIGEIACDDPAILLSGYPENPYDAGKAVAGEQLGEVPVVGQNPQKKYQTEAYPNPFRRETTIRFALKEKENVSLTLFDASGREVDRILQEAPYSAGEHEFQYNAEHLPPGRYFYRFVSSDYSETRELVLLK